MLNFQKLIFGKKESDESLQIFQRLPEDLKRILTLAEIRLVNGLLKQYYMLKQKRVQNISLLFTATEYINKELVLKKKHIPLEAVQAIVFVNKDGVYTNN